MALARPDAVWSGPYWKGLVPSGLGWAWCGLDWDRCGLDRDRCGLDRYWSVPKTRSQRTPGRSQGMRVTCRPAISPLLDSARSNSVS